MKTKMTRKEFENLFPPFVASETKATFLVGLPGVGIEKVQEILD